MKRIVLEVPDHFNLNNKDTWISINEGGQIRTEVKTLENYTPVENEELERLRKLDILMDALEAEGIDNWLGYEMAHERVENET